MRTAFAATALDIEAAGIDRDSGYGIIDAVAAIGSLGLPPPDFASVDRDNFCADDPGDISLSVTGGSGTTLRWFDDTCGGNSIGTGTPLVIPSPTVTTTYYARWENISGNSDCASVTVTVGEVPPPPTNPSPADGATGVPVDAALSWNNGAGASPQDAPVSLLQNGGFETGDFSGWTIVTGPGYEFQPWTLASYGSGSWFGNGVPAEGNYFAQNGFDGESGLYYDIYQEVAIPIAAASAQLEWSDRLQWDTTFGATVERPYQVTLQPAGGGTPLAILFLTALPPGTTGDTGYVTHSIDLLAAAPGIAGQTVRINFHESIPESSMGPAQFDLDGVALTVVENAETYDVYMGDSCESMSLIGSDITSPTYDPPGDLQDCTTYYWKVVAKNGCSEEGPCWSFTTGTPPLAPTEASVDRDNFCPNDPGDISLSATGGSGDTLRWFNDTCGGNSIGTGNPLLIPSPTVTTTYYARWENTCGNSTCASVTVIVTDNENPVITCPGNITQTADVGKCGATITIIPATATDNCGATVAGARSDALPLTDDYPVGTTTITWTATDAALNTDTCAQTVTVTDNEAPMITCPGNITQTADVGKCGATITIIPATATDNCGATVAGVRSDALPLTDDYPVGTTTITWTATDAALNTDTCPQTVTVTVNPGISIPQAKALADTTKLCLGLKEVTAVFSDRFYLEESNRIMGILVVPTAMPPGVAPRKKVDLSGTMGTDANGERCIIEANVVVTGEATVEESVRPFFLGHASVAGPDLLLPLTGFGQQGVVNPFGPNNIGLLIIVCGKVTQIGPDYLYIDDGHNLKDGTLTGAEENVGVRIACNPSVYAAGDYVLVTGVSSCFRLSPTELGRRVQAVEVRKLR
ncbi:MAG: HYR domain-containing protein [Armatimonadota bacterium]|nr:HYR domain-containing protein [Armatimonadota bacterium]